jgi:hypothetical protein
LAENHLIAIDSDVHSAGLMLVPVPNELADPMRFSVVFLQLLVGAVLNGDVIE